MILLSWAPKSLHIVTVVTKQRHHFAYKGLYSAIYGFSNSHVQMWELAECERIDACELWYCRRLESSLHCKKIKTSQSQRKLTLNIHWKDWSWSSATLATWCEEPTHWKRPYAGKDWGQEKRATEDETVGWHHWINGHEFEQTLGEIEGQKGLVCCIVHGSQKVRHDLETEQEQQ